MTAVSLKPIDTPRQPFTSGHVGTPEIIARRIRRYKELGIDCLMLQFHPLMEGLETFAERIIPLLR
jgi:FMNH2-dependent dimethyl sulfone monooxygenase